MKKKYCKGMFALTVVYIIIYSVLISSFQKLDQTELGITKNSITGKVDYNTVYKAGNYFVGPGVNFLRFPSNYQILNATLTSTTSDGNEFSFYYSCYFRINATELVNLYQKFSATYASYYKSQINSLLVGEARSYNMEQYFERNYVYNKMKNVVDKFFKENYSEMGGFELGVLSISSKVTNSIINKVVSEINKNITENKNKASVIRKESEQLYASAVADTNVIMNNALNEGKVMVQNASAKGFELEQESQRIGLSLLEQKLNLSKNNLIHYSWLRDIKNILGSDGKEKLLSDFKKNFLRDLIISKK